MSKFLDVHVTHVKKTFCQQKYYPTHNANYEHIRLEGTIFFFWAPGAASPYLAAIL